MSYQFFTATEYQKPAIKINNFFLVRVNKVDKFFVCVDFEPLRTLSYTTIPL